MGERKPCPYCGATGQIQLHLRVCSEMKMIAHIDELTATRMNFDEVKEQINIAVTKHVLRLSYKKPKGDY